MATCNLLFLNEADVHNIFVEHVSRCQNSCQASVAHICCSLWQDLRRVGIDFELRGWPYKIVDITFELRHDLVLKWEYLVLN